MSGLDGVEKTPPLQTHSITISDHVPGDPDARQCLTLRDQSEATQVMAEPGEGGSETVALPAPQASEEGCVPQDPAGRGGTPQICVVGGRGHVAITAGQEEGQPPAEGLAAASVAVAADHSPKKGVRGGERALELGDAEGSASELTAGAGAEEAPRGKCASASAAVAEEQRAAVVLKEGLAEEEGVEEQMAVEEQPPEGEEIDVAEEEAREEEGPWPLHEALRMDPLEAIQQELDTVNAQADRAFQQLEHKFGRMRRHYLERRNYIIQNIPGFWMTAFRNHPQLSAMIRGQDADMLRYITNLEVKELRHPRTGCKFKFFFRRNPYFRNKLIVKEYEVRSSGRVVSLSTPIIWRRGHEPQSFIRRNQDLICSFFTWFSDHSLPESDKIAEIIKEDLWPNPLQYYLLREGVRRARRRPLREPVEIPRPFGFQSG
ncbi:testis-specific Y-encoded-like protein 1 [Saimiri boliviensis]|uniref:testis-specific Y-encoded-like protein 1 n=1 Tax=Saimiri boliviensis TaxID=27679 RepID=UPI000533FC7B|nr:testis-specific Y-encoded-like protein 1 [Saimiri boliviensis boliviensis]